MIIKDENVLAHYGILRRSGRYPWGSGGTQNVRNKMFLDYVADMRAQGLSDTEIARGLSTPEHPFTTTQLRAAKTIAKNQQKQAQINQALRLKDKGYSNVAIGKRMNIPESTVRNLIAPGAKDKLLVLNSTTDMLREAVNSKKFVDIGTGVEYHLDVSRSKLDAAVAQLKEEGYRVHSVQVDQLGTASGNKTLIKVLAPPGTEYRDIAANKDKIQQVNSYTVDGGRTWFGIQPPISVNSKRIQVKYAEQGGSDADGVIYVRPNVEDLSLGGANYAQVRIAVDNTHYLKGMAMYKDDLPPGVDLVFNTNKSDTGVKHDAFKPLKDDPDNPFGAVVRQIPKVDANGHEIKDSVSSAMNIVNSEGSWEKWSKNLASQMLSKQKPELARQQLSMTYERRKMQLDEINRLTNPSVKKKLLESFADDVDKAATQLKAAALPRIGNHVILPITSLKPTEIYAPNYRNGERVALIRYPHGGKFEIPELTVNNNHPESKRLLKNAKDAVGIHPSVAERLSGADFDGDTVLVIPNNKGLIESEPALKELKNFDPRRSYPAYEGMPKMSAKSKQTEMGKVSNLITDMTIKGANNHELARAVRHSMVVIDAEKHNLDYRQSAIDNDIQGLKEKYQGSRKGGAATLISNAGKATEKVPKRRLRRASEGGPIDPNTGEKVFVPTGETYVDRKTGQTKVVTEDVNKLGNRSDAHTLSSGTRMEKIYADHSNKLKALANEARKSAANTHELSESSSAKKVYHHEVASLNAKLNLALKNRPLERQAQVLANTVVSAKRRDNPDMDHEELKRTKFQALEEARIRTGAKKQDIKIEPREWDAIQAGAISKSKLKDILDNTDLDHVKKLATPRTNTVMTKAKQARASTMLAAGYTQAEVADALGIPIGTLKSSISRGET